MLFSTSTIAQEMGYTWLFASLPIYVSNSFLHGPVKKAPSTPITLRHLNFQPALISLKQIYIL